MPHVGLNLKIGKPDLLEGLGACARNKSMEWTAKGAASFQPDAYSTFVAMHVKALYSTFGVVMSSLEECGRV